jgi:hypothetical protein
LPFFASRDTAAPHHLLYLKWSFEVMALVPPGPVTVTLTVPFFPFGDRTVIEVSELIDTITPSFEPNITTAAPLKPLPVMVTVVLPAE